MRHKLDTEECHSYKNWDKFARTTMSRNNLPEAIGRVIQRQSKTVSHVQHAAIGTYL